MHWVRTVIHSKLQTRRAKEIVRHRIRCADEMIAAIDPKKLLNSVGPAMMPAFGTRIMSEPNQKKKWMTTDIHMYARVSTDWAITMGEREPRRNGLVLVINMSLWRTHTSYKHIRISSTEAIWLAISLRVWGADGHYYLLSTQWDDLGENQPNSDWRMKNILGIMMLATVNRNLS